MAKCRKPAITPQPVDDTSMNLWRLSTALMVMKVTYRQISVPHRHINILLGCKLLSFLGRKKVVVTSNLINYYVYTSSFFTFDSSSLNTLLNIVEDRFFFFTLMSVLYNDVQMDQ